MLEKTSIQVHPNDALAKKDTIFGKTEMWYIMQADQDARIIVGFKRDQTQMSI
jgi:mannose-6-phosphate isomerase